jgi:hypothetical protein
MGVDNIAESSHLWPSLSTVGQPLPDAGALAVCDIDASIRRAKQARRTGVIPAGGITVLEGELIVRGTTRGVGLRGVTSGLEYPSHVRGWCLESMDAQRRDARRAMSRDLAHHWRPLRGAPEVAVGGLVT